MLKKRREERYAKQNRRIPCPRPAHGEWSNPVLGKLDGLPDHCIPAIENELRKHGSGFTGGKQRIMALYQTQPDRKLRAKALAKEYGIGGHSHDFLDGSRGFVNHDWKGLEFDHYPDHQKITLKWAQVEKYIDLMIQSDRYLTDEEKEQRTTVPEENGYKVGDDVMVDLPTGTIEGTIGYIGETDVRIDTSAHGQSWDNEVI